jgi:hypothetical protein
MVHLGHLAVGNSVRWGKLLGILCTGVWHMQVLILLTSFCVMFSNSELSCLFVECLDKICKLDCQVALLN